MSRRKEVLHRTDVEFKLVDSHIVLVSSDESVCWVLRVPRSVEIAPLEEGEGALSYAGVDRLTILSVPNDEGIVLADASEELVIRRELQFQNLLLHTAQNCHGFPCLHVPEDDWRIRFLLEDRTLLSSCDNVARV